MGWLVSTRKVTPTSGSGNEAKPKLLSHGSVESGTEAEREKSYRIIHPTNGVQFTV